MLIREKHRIFARALNNGATIKAAMIRAGFSPKQARKGRKAISKVMIQAIAEQLS